jgi:hypothetical protein
MLILMSPAGATGRLPKPLRLLTRRLPGQNRPLVENQEVHGVRRGHSAKMSSRQKQKTPWTGLSGTHYMTDVENQFWQAVECRSVAAIAPLGSWSVRASFLA